MLCHGTPSDKVFREWLSGVSEGRHAKYINFRVKDGDWNCNTVCIEYEDGSAYRADVTDDWNSFPFDEHVTDTIAQVAI